MPPLSSSLSCGCRLLAFDALDSTNAEALRRAEAGEAGPLWISAAQQTEGRGRAGRRWVSQAGNLYASLLTPLYAPPALAHQLSLVAGVAAFDAIAEAMAPDVRSGLRLKWPNDILIGPAKAGGILVACSTTRAGLVAVIGIGINVAHHPEDLDRPATHLGAHGAAPLPHALLDRLAQAMAGTLAVWADGAGFALLRDAWLQRAGPVGEPLNINTGREPVEGTFAGLDGDGALLLRDREGRERRFSFGDVSLGTHGA